MKQPVNWWQYVSTMVVIIIAVWTASIAQANRISRIEQKVEYTTEQYKDLRAQLNTIQLDIRAILVGMKDKEDRK